MSSKAKYIAYENDESITKKCNESKRFMEKINFIF